MGLFSKIKEGLKKTRKAVMGQIDSMLKSFTKIDEELFEELEELLVMGDVGVPTAEKICDELRKKVEAAENFIQKLQLQAIYVWFNLFTE